MKNNRTLLLLFFTLLLDVIGIGMIIPILPIIFTDPTSPSFVLGSLPEQSYYLIAGAVTALYGIMTFLSSPMLGELSDIYGRKALLRITVTLLVISNAIFAIGILTHSLLTLLISRSIAGISGGNIGIIQASIADITEPKDRAKNFGLIGAAFGMGFIIGPLLGGYISHFFGNAYSPFFLASGLGLLNLFFIQKILPETHLKRTGTFSKKIFKKVFTSILSVRHEKETAPLYLTSFLYVSGFTFFTSFTGVYLVEKFSLSEASLGAYFGVIGLWIVFTQGFLLRIISKHYNEYTLLKISIPLVACSIVAMTSITSMKGAYLLLPLIAIPQGITLANIGSLISKATNKEHQGKALGINGSLSALSQGIIPLLAGLFATTNLKTPFVCAGILGISSLFVLTRYSKKLLTK